jgi:hypothetical protein
LTQKTFARVLLVQDKEIIYDRDSQSGEIIQAHTSVTERIANVENIEEKEAEEEINQIRQTGATVHIEEDTSPSPNDDSSSADNAPPI